MVPSETSARDSLTIRTVRKLPSLPAYLAPQAPVDNPSLHQGRQRTTPHVEGQFAAYVYVPLVVEKQTRLHKLLWHIFTEAKRRVPTLHPIGFRHGDPTADPPLDSKLDDNPPIELHISLSRPTYLRAHQRAEFKRAVQQLAKSQGRFSASFATLSELTNDERTRTFLTLEIGAGHENLKNISNELTPILKSIRQQEFYQDPRFHASVAWALLDSLSVSTAAVPGTGPSTHIDVTDEIQTQTSPDANPSAPANPEFPTIPHFPASLIPELRDAFVQELVRPGVGTFEVEEVHVRIGKEVSKWRLRD
ncbi:U6 snRNA phosphodiesterase Usb1 [Trametes maxima]|nr:U6 snRNA phosphodiesterase Usb1 [Trametes maxima]